MSPCECDWTTCGGDGLLRCRGCLAGDGEDGGTCHCERHTSGTTRCYCAACTDEDDV